MDEGPGLLAIRATARSRKEEVHPLTDKGSVGMESGGRTRSDYDPCQCQEELRWFVPCERAMREQR